VGATDNAKFSFALDAKSLGPISPSIIRTRKTIPIASQMPGSPKSAIAIAVPIAAAPILAILFPIRIVIRI